MANIKLPGDRRVTISRPSGSRKAKTGFISIKGKPGSATAGAKK